MNTLKFRLEKSASAGIQYLSKDIESIYSLVVSGDYSRALYELEQLNTLYCNVMELVACLRDIKS